MKNYIKHDAWCIIEDGFYPQHNEITESLMSLGNGRMGQRANFEEKYSGKTLQGNYIAGVYFPDKTRVGWWKNGYPRYFAKVLNACNWNLIGVVVDDVELDLANCEVSNFERRLDMQKGILTRSFQAKMSHGREIEVKSTRLCSMQDDEAAVIEYKIKALNFKGSITVTPALDGDIKNKDSNYDEKFWDEIEIESDNDEAYLQLKTKANNYEVEQFDVATGMKFTLNVDDNDIKFRSRVVKNTKFIGREIDVDLSADQTLTITKYVSNLASLNYPKSVLIEQSKKFLGKFAAKGFETIKAEHIAIWASKWENNDIQIKGDISAQQGIRFNIFHLNQTYTGQDERLNIGPKGFTGEKYGGSTYWDTEAYCLPFYLATSSQEVGRQLLVYRHKQLGKAIENAQNNLGFKDGAALYPMVTMTGEECHNEWEITFEEIHRNGAIAYAIFDYINYTGDANYLVEHGLEVLIGISRFWSQRVNWSKNKNQYVMLGVTGPNEYENNVNNNFYTNYLASWCLKYTIESIEKAKSLNLSATQNLFEKIKFDENYEIEKFGDIVDKMYLPKDEKLGIYLQQDGFLDKELIKVADLDTKDRPLNQKWSWDRILRSCFIKQADVLQGFYFFEDDFDNAELKRNFDFYEPMTVHESSLSPCVHVILAAKLGYEAKAYEMYLRTSRLDIDDYNNDTEDGLHITSMAGTWMSVVKGFGGFRVKDDVLHFNTMLPSGWESFSFRIGYRGAILNVEINKNGVEIENFSEETLPCVINGKSVELNSKSKIISE
jgi:maltose phosphorylase